MAKYPDILTAAATKKKKKWVLSKLVTYVAKKKVRINHCTNGT